ncbi:S9 family peptidase [Rudaeicoccus suwonensis]|uniref:Oligopeptidase B n=1 Tax=Rudaeicoccus suwonensis TaxID=657409 RepID=A0A561ECB2_9MICO|nr:S9 family peptidase [Rudaeicoccus suwonensis]TWE13227.1 oligopeptidase B [Rudaeicoccus suwonensis]
MSHVEPPVAQRIQHSRTFHGDTVVDDYEWLRDKENPEVVAHLEAENAYTMARTSHLSPLADQVFAEIKAHTQETDVSVPVRLHDWWYFTRTQEGAQYPLHCRVPYDAGAVAPQIDAGAPLVGEQVLIDGNREAQGQEFFELGALEVDPTGARIAVLVDFAGDERYALQVRDVATGDVLDEAVGGAGYGVAWSCDGQWVFYTRVDDAWRQFQVWRHHVGSSADQDVLVLQEDDEVFGLGFDVSRDERWLILHAGSSTTGEVRLLDLQQPTGDPVLVQQRQAGLDYSVEVDGDRILITHNASRVDFDISWAPMATPRQEHWQPLMSAGEGERILGVDAFESFLAVTMRSGGLPAVRIIAKDGDGYGSPRPVPVEGGLRAVRVGSTPMYDSRTLQLLVTSFLVAGDTYDLDVASDGAVLLKRRHVPGFDPQQYVEERLWVTATDGRSVPVSMVRARGIQPDGTNPGYLYGYGSYEIPIDASFSAARLSLLDRGVVFAIAHIRGGGELGRGWYDEGKLLAKRNTFTDFVDCARALIDLGWVAPDRLAAEGRSAGGLLMGAVVNLAPELFRVVHAGVPFVDALTTILDPTLPLTAGEWEEWGNPIESREVYDYMKSYTPYENIQAVDYPAILATTSVNDTRVFFVEPTKWVQRLRETVTSDHSDRPILQKTEIVAGHGGRSGRYDAWHDTAFEYAFMLDQLGATQLLNGTVA